MKVPKVKLNYGLKSSPLLIRKEKEWEKEFNKKFCHKTKLGLDLDLNKLTIQEIKQFISELLSHQEKEFFQKHDKHTEHHIKIREEALSAQKEEFKQTLKEKSKKLERELANSKQMFGGTKETDMAYRDGYTEALEDLK